MFARCKVLVIAVLTAALIQGCGGGPRTVRVSGKLVKSGAKYEVPGDQAVQMAFIAMEVEGPDGKMTANSEPYPAEYHPSQGEFSVPGPDGYGIPAGKYRICVIQTMTSEAAAKQPGANREIDLLGSKFGESTSPIIRELKKDAVLTIDLDKPTE